MMYKDSNRSRIASKYKSIGNMFFVLSGTMFLMSFGGIFYARHAKTEKLQHIKRIVTAALEEGKIEGPAAEPFKEIQKVVATEKDTSQTEEPADTLNSEDNATDSLEPQPQRTKRKEQEADTAYEKTDTAGKPKSTSGSNGGKEASTGGDITEGGDSKRKQTRGTEDSSGGKAKKDSSTSKVKKENIGGTRRDTSNKKGSNIGSGSRSKENKDSTARKTTRDSTRRAK